MTAGNSWKFPDCENLNQKISASPAVFPGAWQSHLILTANPYILAQSR
jgi:hypothetical protein